jgi:DNA polymerase-3 subunit delta'
MLFSEIIGHNRLKNKLIETANDNRISHTLMFYGGEGSENLSLAIAYAQYISCTNKQSVADDEMLIGDSCGECPSCKKYANLAHPDLNFIFPVANTKEHKSKPVSSMFMDHWRELLIENKGYISENEWYAKIGIENKQGRIGVDDANEIIRLAANTPYESEYNIIIIWMVEKLYHAAAPKLLKILEEPPENTLFFLVSFDLEQILKTILSRTQLIKLQRHPDEEMRRYLKRYFGLEGDKLDYVVNMAEGNFRNVFSLMEEDTANRDLENFRQMMQLSYANNFIKLKDKVNTLAGTGRERIKAFLNYGLRIVRLCVIYELGNQKLLRATKAEFDFVSKFAKFVNRSNAGEISDEITLAIKHIERNGNAKIVLMDFALKMVLLFDKQKRNKKGS